MNALHSDFIKYLVEKVRFLKKMFEKVSENFGNSGKPRTKNLCIPFLKYADSERKPCSYSLRFTKSTFWLALKKNLLIRLTLQHKEVSRRQICCSRQR